MTTLLAPVGSSLHLCLCLPSVPSPQPQGQHNVVCSCTSKKHKAKDLGKESRQTSPTRHLPPHRGGHCCTLSVNESDSLHLPNTRVSQESQRWPGGTQGTHLTTNSDTAVAGSSCPRPTLLLTPEWSGHCSVYGEGRTVWGCGEEAALGDT